MKQIICAALVLISISSFAQQATVKWNEPSKDEYNYYAFIRGNGNDMIKVSFVGKLKLFSIPKLRCLITRYNDKLEVAAEREYENEQKDAMFGKVALIGGNLFMITYVYDRGEDMTTYYRQAIDYNTLEAVGQPVAIATMDAAKKSRQADVDFALSLDSTKLLLFTTAAYDRKSNLKYSFSVFDRNMKKMWNKTIELPILDKFVDVMDIALTNEGKVAVILKHYDQEITREKVRDDGANVPAYKTKLLVYDSKSAKPQEYVIDLGNKFVQTLTITDDKASGLDLFGLYKTKYNGYVNGYFTCNLDAEKLQVKTKLMEKFPDDFIDRVSHDRFGSDRESDPGISGNFKLMAKIDRNGYGTDYVLEYYIVKVYTSYNASTGTTSTHTDYIKGDIADVFVDKAGKVVVTRIPKYQFSGSPLFEGFTALPYKDKLLLFYNDDRDNVTQDITKRPDDVKNFNKSILLMAAVSPTGDVARSMVIDNRKEDLTSCPELSGKLDGNRIVLYSRKGLGIFGPAKEYVGMLEVK